jgi:tetratricopeptide (TPR) repeat protein
MQERPPKTFISYSHDSPEHADRVLALADRLRADGVDAIIDQYETSPPEGWPLWMDKQIDESDFVLLVCTETYYRRVMNREEPGRGLGVRWEGNLIYQHLFDAATTNTRFIPIMLEGGSPAHIPRPVKGATYYFVDADGGYEDLYRRLTGQPKVAKQELGERKVLGARPRVWRESPEKPLIQTQAAQVAGNNNVVIQAFGNDIRVNLDRAGTLALSRLHRKARPVRTDLDLLNPFCRAIPLIGREAELAALGGWLAGDRPIAVRGLAGRAGSGKTRLAVELCAAAEQRGWLAGFVDPRELLTFAEREDLGSFDWSYPTLIVVDHALVAARALRQWLVELSRHPGDTTQPLRLLLLTRHADAGFGWWSELTTPRGFDEEAILDLLDPPEPWPLQSIADAGQRRAILAAVMGEAAKLNPRARTAEVPAAGVDPDFDRRLASPDLQFEPLFLLMAGIDAVSHGVPGMLALGRTDLADRLAGYELGRLKELAEERQLSGAFLAHMAGCITLTGGCSGEQLADAVAGEQEALREAGSVAELTRALREALPAAQGKGAGPIVPELIGEAAVLGAFRNRSPAEKAAIVERAGARAPAAVADCVIRIAQDYAATADHDALAWLDVLVAGAKDVEAVVALCDRLPERSINLLDKAAEIEARAVAQLRDADSEDPNEAVAAELARRLARFADRLGRCGHLEEAFAAAEEAVARYRALAAASPKVFRPILASALVTLANRLSPLGRYEEALQACEEGIVLLRALSAEDGEADRAHLAHAVSDHASHLGHLGRRQDALAAAEEAVGLYRELVAVRAEPFEPELARALNNLAVHRAALGRGEDALAAGNEAVGFYRELAAARPDGYRFQLALSLHALAAHLTGLGRGGEALAAIEEAVAILRGLAEARPQTFRPELVMVLNTSAGCLFLCERADEAGAAAGEAVTLARALAEARPASHEALLAASLNNLSNVLGALGRTGDAVVAVREAAELYRRLAAVRPLRHRPDLASTLTNLASRLREAGAVDGALAAAEEAAAIRRELAARLPSVYQPALDRSLQLLADLSADGAAPSEPEAPLETEAPAPAAGSPAAAPRYAHGGAAAPMLAAADHAVAPFASDPAEPPAGAANTEENKPMIDVSSLATACVAAMVPCFSEAGKAVATKLGEATVAGAERVVNLVRGKLTRPEQQQALADLEAAPEDPDNQADVRKKLKQALAEDEGFCKELAELLEALPKGGDQTMKIAGDQNVGAQASGSHIKISVGR